ncbi:hypothetical protein HWV62_11243 [Athelia sp. TMB]|nr:hypothetical protein HWV62_11243 [Athelia sp. TMB]
MLNYLVARIDNSHGRLGDLTTYILRESDTPTYRALLNEAVVALKTSSTKSQPARRFQVYPPMMYMKEIIDKAQEMLFAKSGGKPGNVITSGYRQVSGRGFQGKSGRPGIENAFVNTIITALKAPEWETLLERLGIDVMLHLLTETSIFVSLPNQCLCQVTGDPLIHMIPPTPVLQRPPRLAPEAACSAEMRPAKRKAIDHQDERPNKRMRLCETITPSPIAKRATSMNTIALDSVPPVDIRVIRTRMFYSRPECAPNLNYVVVGLPPRHILNRLYPSYLRKPKLNPSQYVDPDPKVQAEQARHLAKYVFPRQYGLSSVFKASAPQSKFSAVSIPDFSDREKEIKALGSCKTPKRLKETLSLLEKMVWRHSKCAYKALRDKACPSKIKPDGSEVPDSSVILEMMSERSIYFHTQAALPDLNISADTSAWPNTQTNKKSKIKPRFAEFTCSHTEVYRYAVLVTDAVIPKAFWGSTRNSRLMMAPFRNQVLYFRHDDWDILCTPLIGRLTSDTFEKITEFEATELLRQRKLGFSFVRLLPKETGSVSGRAEQSINQILQAAFQILNYEKQSRPDLLGASVFGTNDFYTKLKAFKIRLQANHSGNLPNLYFVKLDVQACFDTIEQSKLLHILKDLITEDAYCIQRYGQVSAVAGKIQRKYVKKACPQDEQPHFLEYAAELARALRNIIFVDQVQYQSVKRNDVLRLLEEHITENIVKIGQDYYRQMVGIPQGSVLSTLLCSFFYGDLETRQFKFNEDPESMLLRHIDDYLLVTTSLPKARSFLHSMNQGHPEYGCIIAQDKTLTNFDNGPQIMNVTDPNQRTFPWCGYSIDMRNLSVSVDYTRYQGNCLQDSLTVEKGKRPGAAFVHKMLQQAKLRSHIVYCDMGLNTEHTVYLNVYQNFVLTAMKMHRYIRTWGINTIKNSAFIERAIQQIILHTYTSIRNKGSNHVARVSAGRCEILKTHARDARILHRLGAQVVLLRCGGEAPQIRPVSAASARVSSAVSLPGEGGIGFDDSHHVLRPDDETP